MSSKFGSIVEQESTMEDTSIVFPYGEWKRSMVAIMVEVVAVALQNPRVMMSMMTYHSKVSFFNA